MMATCTFRKFHPAWESHRRVESSHDRGRCSRSCIRSQCSLSISSSCRAGLKPRTCAADDGFVQRDGRGHVCILAREILQRFSRTRFNGPSVKNGRRPFRCTSALPRNRKSIRDLAMSQECQKAVMAAIRLTGRYGMSSRDDPDQSALMLAARITCPTSRFRRR